MTGQRFAEGNAAARRGLNRWVLPLLLVAAGAVTAPRPAAGYVRTRTDEGQAMRWANPAIPLQVYLGDPPSRLTREQVLGAVVAAAGTWSHDTLACTGLALTVSSSDEANGPAADDRLNRITFRRESWQRQPCDPNKLGDCVRYDPDALAITSVLAVRKTGEIVDGDMELNAINHEWGALSVPPDPQEGAVQDLQNTLTHELGHLIGHDHNCTDRATRGVPVDHLGQALPSCFEAPPALRAATMFNSAAPLDVGKRDLAEDDAQAVCDIYPFGQGVVDLSGREAERGGCAVAPAGRGGKAPAPIGCLLAALALGWSRRRRCRRA